MDEQAAIIERMNRWAAYRWQPSAQTSRPIVQLSPAGRVTNSCSIAHWTDAPETDRYDAGLALGGAWETSDEIIVHAMHSEPESIVTLGAGTRLRCERSLCVTANVWGIDAFLFRFLVLTGRLTRDCVWLEADERANLTRLGLRAIAS